MVVVPHGNITLFCFQTDALQADIVGVRCAAEDAQGLLGCHFFLIATGRFQGDGDLGISTSKGVTGVRAYMEANRPSEDLGKYIAGLGMAYNKAGPSTMGALVATALMRAGRLKEHTRLAARVFSHL